MPRCSVLFRSLAGRTEEAEEDKGDTVLQSNRTLWISLKNQRIEEVYSCSFINKLDGLFLSTHSKNTLASPPLLARLGWPLSLLADVFLRGRLDSAFGVVLSLARRSWKANRSIAINVHQNSCAGKVHVTDKKNTQTCAKVSWQFLKSVILRMLCYTKCTQYICLPLWTNSCLQCLENRKHSMRKSFGARGCLTRKLSHHRD